MYERSYGSKYDQAKDKSTAEIAKMIRKDIKAAQADGTLPADLKVSVRSESFAGGSAIRVRVQYQDRFWTKGTNHWGDEVDVLTEEGEVVKATLQAIHWAYNHDGSDTMTDYFDVNYYGQVEIEGTWGRDFRLQESERQAQRKAEAAERKQVVEALVAHGYRKGVLRRYSLDALKRRLAEIEERKAAGQPVLVR